MQYSGYVINCNVCGTKKAAWTTKKEDAAFAVKDLAVKTWGKQQTQVTERQHTGHKWEYVSKIVGATKGQFDAWRKENT